ncbi:hypothetical protein MBLNU13_g00851t2 [Cladosporium sp. NU13]
MEHGSEDLSWLHDCVEDLDFDIAKFNGANLETELFGEQALERRDHDAHHLMQTGFVNEFVNPADLHRVQEDVSTPSGQTDQTTIPSEAHTSPIESGSIGISAMDEFFRLQVIGFPWTMRIIGFLSLACCTVACLTLQTRPMSPSTETKSTNARPNLLTTLRHAIDLRPLAHDPSYLTTTLAITVIEFAVFLPITYLPSAALASNLPPQTSYRLIAFLNAGSVPGRALPNYLSDHFGRFNVMIITALACTLLIFCLWLPPTALDVRSEAALTVFAVLFGFWSGAAISLTPVCVAQFWGVGWGADWRGDRGWESWRGVFVVGGLCWGLLCTGVGGVWGGEICRWAEEVVGGVLM